MDLFRWMNAHIPTVGIGDTKEPIESVFFKTAACAKILPGNGMGGPSILVDMSRCKMENGNLYAYGRDN